MDKAYTINRLQFRHHIEVFENREAAIAYISGATAGIRDAETGLAVDDDNNIGVGTKYGYSLFSEPTILRYKNITSGDPTGEVDPFIILAIGSVTNDKPNETGEVWHSNNKFCIIDIHKVESEIEDLWEEIEKIIKSLNIITTDTPSLDLDSEWVDGEGIYLSGNVKTAKTHNFSGITQQSSLMVASGDPEEGLFIYVNLEYDEPAETFKFVASNWDGTLKETSVKLPNNYLVSGEYSIKDESIHLHMKNGDDVVVSCEQLIDEWAVEGNASKTPIVLFREENLSGSTEPHEHTGTWQDVLWADVRIEAGAGINNILKKTPEGTNLYVDGVATNIKYNWNGSATTVADTLNELKRIKIAADRSNILQDRTDGYFANIQLDYISSENKLVLRTTNVDGTTKEKFIQLNTVDIPIENIYYNPTTEELIIIWKNDKGEVKTIKIPITDMIDEWEVLNPGHNVKLNRVHKVSGKDQLSADANIYGVNDGHTDNDNNILVDRDHSLYVRGTADNIKYNDATVEGALDNLKSEDERIEQKLDDEIARATGEEEIIEEKFDLLIGSGFTPDVHENVTAKFEKLTSDLASEVERATGEEQRIDDKLDVEIERATGEEQRIDGKLDDEIQRAQNAETALQAAIESEVQRAQDAEGVLQNEIDAVSANTIVSLKKITSEDNSIIVETTEASGPQKGKDVDLSVNLSEEVEDDRYNIIKLNADGLFANVDLSYEKTANKLIFHTSNGQPDKEIQLDSMSSIISIEYNPSKEAIVITYMTNGHEIKTVEIPVGDLINEWRVEDGHPNAVQLVKDRIASGTTEQDVLRASVIITSAHTDNILVMDDGALYVSNSGVAANAEAIAEEITRAETAEQALDDKITTEKNRAEAAEQALQNEIDAEELRAINVENYISGAVTTEIQRASSAEHDLNDKIDQEIADRITDVNAEETRAISAETELNAAITLERERAINSENTLNTTLSSKIEQAATELSAEIRTKVNEEQTRAMNAEGALEQAIANEKARAEQADALLQDDINDEIERSKAKDDEHDAKIIILETSANTLDRTLQDEIVRAISADTTERTRAISAETAIRNDLTDAINDERTRALIAENALSSFTITSINNEVARATVAENTLNGRLDNEIDRSTRRDTELQNAIEAEKAAREADVEALEDAIEAATFTFDDTQSIDFTVSDDNVVTAKVKIANSNGNIILNPEGTTYEGLFASVRLDYDQTTNKIQLYVNDTLQDEKLLSSGALLDSIVYDSVNRALVITYTDANGTQHQLSFPVNELFNDWDVKNPSSGSAIELTKIVVGGGYNDELSGRVLLTNLPDNAVQIVNNGLYVKDSSEDIECVDSKAEMLYTLLYGSGSTMSQCGSGDTYVPDKWNCVLSAATSFYDADRAMAYQICEILEMWVSAMTCTTTSEWVDDGANKKMLVNVRPSHGSDMTMTDEELYITNLTGDTIEVGVTEFTDTNALRIVCLNEGPVIPGIETTQNGIYLSNVWDCGRYYGPSDAEQADAAQAAADGYNVDYHTDESGDASGYDYNNNVRQQDPLG